MKTPSSSKSFQPTLTGTSTNKSGLLTKVTPGKRVLDFLSAVSHLRILHMVGGKLMYGYLLKVGNIMKGRSIKV